MDEAPALPLEHESPKVEELADLCDRLLFLTGRVERRERCLD
jgi:hypothetical protein